MTLASLDLFSETAPSPILVGAEDIVKAQALPPLDVAGFDTMTSLGYRASRAQMPDWLAIREREMTEDAIAQAYKLTGRKLINPFAATEYDEMREIRRRALRGEDIREAAPTSREERRAKFEAEYAAIRKDFPELPDPAVFRQTAIEDLRKRVRELAAQQRTATGLGDVGQFVGDVGGQMMHPINLMTLPLGAPSALWAPARAGLIGALAQAAKVGGIESLIGAGAQVPIGLEKMDRLPLLGLAYGWPEFFEEVGGAAGAGFLLGAGMRGLVGAWRGVRGRIGRDAIHPELRLAADDGATVGERLLKDAEASPFAPGRGDLHAEATARAYADVAEGRPAGTAEMVGAARTEARAARAADEAVPEGPFAAPARETTSSAAKAAPDAPYAVAATAERAASDARALAGKQAALAGALDEAAAQWQQLRAAVARGAVDKRMDQTPALADAVRLIGEAEARGESLAAVSERARPSLETQAFMAMMAKDPLAEKLAPAGRAEIAARLRDYADEAMTVAPESEFAGAAAPLSILDRIGGLQRAIAARIAREAEELPTPELRAAADIQAAKERLAGDALPADAAGARAALGEAAAQEADAAAEAMAAGWKPSRATRKEIADAVRPRGDEAPGAGISPGAGRSDAARLGEERAAAGAEPQPAAAAGDRSLSRAGAEEAEFEIPVGIDGEGKAIMQPARLALEEAEAAERAAAQILACATGGAL